MASIFEYISYGEFTRFIVCLTLDVVEYLLPILLTPFVGDVFDIVGLVSCLFMFRWIGLFALLELVVGFDPLPINVLAWAIWMLNRRRDELRYLMK